MAFTAADVKTLREMTGDCSYDSGLDWKTTVPASKAFENLRKDNRNSR